MKCKVSKLDGTSLGDLLGWALQLDKDAKDCNERIQFIRKAEAERCSTE